ncbi:MAG TPA: ferric reductase-like transmembrane domain-containing protein [Candidatus Acidoferrales bacterium]|nr:ferric reductase-like transmembrane domain-containing protein [Candidatus Acidoferrales bacterium]
MKPLRAKPRPRINALCRAAADGTKVGREPEPLGVMPLDLSADAGLIAVGFATANILIGLMIFGRYSPVRYWPHRRFDIFRIHRWAGYGTLGFTLLHPLPLLLNAAPRFRVVDIAFPVWSPLQPLENTIGAAALYLFVIIIVTSLYRIELGRHIWKLFHYLTYVAAAALFLHGILTDPNLSGRSVDYLDGGKVFVEICLIIIIGASIWRLRHARRITRSH